ncbi:hypothetical protein O181_033030 [Austropuccinia psidii MF-1]|uniref:Uncharacterized protein n=1 Tax=Austropuccinia psidii MF-1 TaxID=1389203 RepID=A0A9Q3H8T6_9BASI|nr:hypothetical protein [Austropuccinia psidii MF-1]
MYGGIPPYTCPGSLLFCAHTSLRFARIPTLHMKIVTPVRDPDSVHTNPHACTGSQQSKPLLLLGKAPDNSNKCLRLCRLPTLHTQILTLVQVPDNSKNSLLLCRLLMLKTQILMLLKVPDSSEDFLLWLRLLTLHTQILMPVQVPNDSDNSLRRGSLPRIPKIPYTTKINSMQS